MGPTQQRHVVASRVRLIGKETNTVGEGCEVIEDESEVRVFE